MVLLGETMKKTMNLVRDKESGLLYKEETLHLNEQDEYIRYQSHNNGLDNPDYMAYQKRIYDEFISKFLIGDNHLDFGCGQFAAMKIITDKNLAVYDKYFHNDPIVFMKQYDTIWLIEVVEHFKDPYEEFERLFKMLNHQGRLIIQTEFIPKENLDNWWYLRDKTHYTFYDDQSFKVISNKIGFEVIFSNHINQIVLEKKENFKR